jgi:hypothetical protein
MMNNINQPILLPNLTQQLRSRRSRWINMLPLLPNTECFLSPSTERDCLNDRWCNNFLSRECTPGHRINRLGVGGFKIARSVGGKECDFVRKILEFTLQLCPICGWEKDFDEGLYKSASITMILGTERTYLLKDESVPRTPTENFISAFDAIHGRLTSNRPPTLGIQLQEFITDSGGFRIESFFTPGYCFEVTGNMAAEDG